MNASKSVKDDLQVNPATLARLEKQVEGVVLRSLSEQLKTIVHGAVHDGMVKVLQDNIPAPAKPKPDHVERNGVVKPPRPGKCLQVWEELDKLVAKKKTPTLEMIQAIAAKKGWNTSNARVEFYRWKKFHA